MKEIVTHINPDLDAVASVWLIKRFLLGWEEAEIGFVQATSSGEKIAGVDDNPDILYVDVGRGKLDHHQTGNYLSATKLCWDYILEKRKNQPLRELEKEAIDQLVEVVTQIDNARDLKWQEVTTSRYQFFLSSLIFGLKGIGESDFQVMEFGLRALDAVFLNLKNQIKAEEELQKGEEFETPWGKAIALSTGNEMVLWRGEIKGYVLVLRKDPETGAVQIYSRWDAEVDLTAAFEKFQKLDPQSDWFLHASKKLLLNQASVNPDMRPTKLSLKQIIEVLKK